jgi:transcriptional regulator with XRE-family HTH domain
VLFRLARIRHPKETPPPRGPATALIDDQSFGEAVKELRDQPAIDWSQETLADIADVSRATMWNIEHGKHSAALDTIDLIARALGVNPGDLLNRAQEIKARRTLDIQKRAAP